MTIKYDKRTLPYKVLLAFILIVEMHYFGLFTLPNELEFIIYTNKAKWIGAAAVVSALVCYRNHKSVLIQYMGFLRKYLKVVVVSILLISLYTTFKYPLNPLITTYGFASYYLYSFLAIPILYVCSVEGGYKSLFRVLNYITVIMYVITIINGISYMQTGRLLFSYSSVDLSGGLVRDGKVRLSSGAFGVLMIIYNFYRLYNLKKEKITKKVEPVFSLLLGVLSILVTGNSRIMLLTLLASLGILVLLGDGSSKKKLIAIAAISAGMGIILKSDIVTKFLESFSSSGELGGSSIARFGAYKYYFECFIKNPVFAIGFAGDDNYYDIVHGASDIYYQTVYVRYFYDDVGIVGQLALLGIFLVGIYIWPVCRTVKIALKCCRSKFFSEGKFVMAIVCYLICTTPTLIILDAGRVIAFPFVLATAEFIYAKYRQER